MKKRYFYVCIISVIVALVTGVGTVILSGLPLKWVIAVIAVVGLAPIMLMVRNVKRVLLFGLAFIVPVSIGTGLPPILERLDHIGSWNTLDIQLIDILVLLLLMYHLARWMIGRVQIRFYPFTTIPAFAWLFACSLSIAVAREPDFSIILVGVMVKLWLLYIVVANSIEDAADIMWLTTALSLGVLLQGSLGIYQGIAGHTLGLYALGETPQLFYGRSLGTIGHPNGYGMYLAATMPLILALLFLKIHGFYKALAVAVLCVGMLGMVFSLSRGAWVAFILASIAVLVFTIRRNRQNLRIALVGAGSFILIFLLLILSQRDLITARLTSKTADESALSRIPLAQTGIAIFLDYPVLGVGLNNYELIVPEYDPASSRGVTMVHNGYLLIAAETGLVGMVTFLWFLVSLFIQAYRLISRAPNDIAWLAGVGAFSAFIVISIHNIVDYGMLATAPVFRLLWVFASIIV
jgi:O-antigen ligase